MQRAHKIRMIPTKKQAIALKRAMGTSRYCFNWALAEWKSWYDDFKAGKRLDKPSANKLDALWTKIRPDWTKEIVRQLQTRAILNVGVAFTNFWQNGADYPTFKKKSDYGSFYITNTIPRIFGKRIRLLESGDIKLREKLRYTGKILSYSISGRAGEWYVSVQVEIPDPVRTVDNSVVGVDVGCKSIAVASDGTVCENPKGLTKAQKKLAHLQRELNRRKKGSNRHARTRLRIAKIHKHIKNQRTDSIHKFTTAIAKNHGTVVVETLNVEDMKRQAQGPLALSIQDTAMREVHRQLEYKAAKLERAPPFYPSSKTCSSCGHVKESLPLGIRTYKCGCGLSLDRDLNAAYNLRDRRWVTASSRVEGPKGSLKRETKIEEALSF